MANPCIIKTYGAGGDGSFKRSNKLTKKG